MAPTFRHAKDAFFSLTSATGGTITCSSGFDDLALKRTVDTAEVTTYAEDDKVYLAGLRDGTIPFAGNFSSTHEKKFAALLGHSTRPTFIYGPESNSTGRRKYTGKSILTSLDVSSPIGGRIAVAGTLQLSGAITSTVF